MVQDASRRDLTINALFYNLNTGTVEDFTERGLADLRAGICRTPLPPLETFLDGQRSSCPAFRKALSAQGYLWLERSRTT